MFGFKKKKMMLEWQNTLLENPVPKLIMNENLLVEQTLIRLDNDLRIAKDCIKIIENTTKPDVFFERLSLMEEVSKDMVRFEKYFSVTNIKPSDALNEFYTNKQESIRQFLIRYFCAVFDKAEKLKTDKGKVNQYKKFYDSLQEYYEIMNEENIDYIETKYKAYTRNKAT